MDTQPEDWGLERYRTDVERKCSCSHVNQTVLLPAIRSTSWISAQCASFNQLLTVLITPVLFLLIPSNRDWPFPCILAQCELPGTVLSARTQVAAQSCATVG
eukprot:TRINITY_DN33080_c0_g1_i1.p1 TRINITY_DN33080_c0_g1~~TRINITY_DN33080_c0_g1_i1.p1  ORF type:complete len:102 (+),score=1.61 TRINITY_DN33080_c0_g1_i1:199-504(+)